MKTIDGQVTKKSSVWHKLKRDILLIVQIVKMLYVYLTTGSRVRKKYKDKVARGEIFWVDEEIKL